MNTPATLAELVDVVRSSPRVIVIGAGTKPRLSQVPADVVRISTAKLRGIVEYEPSEFTFTALAGTPLHDIVAALAEKGQYLPFDPVLADAGATLGGTVGAGLSGSGRFRYGGLRDFILGVRFVDGEGRLLRLGGKVVKNAAGFDLPKFFVGSAGRFAALAEITFKVFPRVATSRTLRLETKDAATMVGVLNQAGNTRWELDALDASPAEGLVFARLVGPPAATEVLAREMLVRWPGVALGEEAAAKWWRDTSEFAWAHAGGTLIKIALTPSQLPELAAVPQARVRVSAGGNVGYLSIPAGVPWSSLAKVLEAKPAVTLRGDAPLWPGAKPRFDVMRAVKAALDPQNRFPQLDE